MISEKERQKQRVEHHRKYIRLCRKHGVRWNDDSPKLVGVTKEQLRQCALEDDALNNIPLSRWDSLAMSFLMYNSGSGLSFSEALCMQKAAARELVGVEPKSEVTGG